MNARKCFLAFLILHLGYICLGQEITNTSRWPYGVTYEIFIQSFADSDGDGIGDLNGVILKLDYLADLGIEAIWFMPVHPSPSYHKYDVADYFEIHPDYGTIETFKKLVNEALKRNIKIIIDLVVNHTSTENSWFKNAINNKKSNYWDYYIWKYNNDNELKEKRWYKAKNSKYYYFGHFSSRMPDLNFDNQMVRNDIINIGRYWLEEIGVAGFRLDAAKHIFPDGRNSDNLSWWKYFETEMRKINEDVYLVGEVWGTASEAAPYLEGLSAVFNFEMQSELLKAVLSKNGTTLADKYNEIIKTYKQYSSNYIDATFLSNHDIDRLQSLVNDDTGKAKISVALLLTLPGSPYIYYGEEIGMKGRKPDQYIREPFLWDDITIDNYRTKWIDAVYSTDSTVTPAKLQEHDQSSIFNHYKKLIHLRKSSSAFTLGDIKTVALGEPSVCAFTRSYNNEKVMAMHNLSDKAVVINIKDDWLNFKKILFANNQSFITNDQIILAGYSTMLLEY